jgi:hypothetical protein
VVGRDYSTAPFPPALDYWWADYQGYVECIPGGFGGPVGVNLFCGETDWTVELYVNSRAAAVYILPRGEWSCTECNTLTFAGQVGDPPGPPSGFHCCDYPETITVCPGMSLGIAPPAPAKKLRATGPRKVSGCGCKGANG